MLFANSPKSLLILILTLGISLGQANVDNVELKSQNTTGVPVILAQETQNLAGLKTVKIKSAYRQDEFETIGKVISIEPLLILRERYLLAQAELKSASAHLKQTGQSWQRQQELFSNGISAKRSLQELDAQKLVGQAAVDSSRIRVLTIVNEAKLNWGKTLAQWLLGERTDELKAILAGQQQLLQITLPANKQFPDHLRQINVEPSGDRAQAKAAQLISRSVQVDTMAQGENYFFQTSGESLRTGMKITAWVPESANPEKGVVVPESALVWYMDQAYFYVKTAETTFSRRSVSRITRVSEGYFIRDTLQEGDEIVITGGQMLLSEELRGQIPDED